MSNAAIHTKRQNAVSGKESALRLLDEEYQDLRRAIDGLDEGQLSRVWFGTWAARDILAHIVGWQREATGVLRRLARGDHVAMDEGPTDADEWNARFVEEMAPISPEALLASWSEVHADYVQAAKGLPDDCFGQGKTASRLLQRTAIEDFRRHAADICEWRQREGI